MSGIFISYRRQDAAGYAARLQEDLSRIFGEENIFLDISFLQPGADFAEALRAAIEGSEVIIVVIGPEWLTATDPQGRRRVDDPNDFIRSEVSAALNLNKLVVPALVGGATMPQPADLPMDLNRLANLNALQLRDEDWQRSVQALGTIIKKLQGPQAGMAATERPGVMLSPERPTAKKSPLSQRIGQAWRALRGLSEADRRARTATSTSGFGGFAERGISKAPITTAKTVSYAVFISHSNLDKDFANDLVSALEKQQFECWIAPRDIPEGAPSWAEPIVTAIANSRLVLVLLTVNSMSSIEVLREVTIAADEKIPLLPVRLDATPLSPGLRYFFAAAQRYDVSHEPTTQQLLRIPPVVAKRLSP